MITFLALPRAFVGEFDGLQRAAIRSWHRAALGCEVLLFGADVPDGLPLAYHATGAPLVDGVFAYAEQAACHDWLCFTSADIVFDSNLTAIVDKVAHRKRPLLIGQRWDIEAGAPPVLHAPCGVDYFLYRKGTIGAVLPFTVRGGGGDNWMVWKALNAWDMTVIDATQSIVALHHSHSHPEWANGKAGRQGSAEQAYNRALYQADGMTRPFGVDDAPWLLVDGQVVERDRVAA